MDKQMISVQAMQIERIILPGSKDGSISRNAQFYCGKLFCCNACFEDGEPSIVTVGIQMNIEQANMVATSIQLAIEWLLEEKQRRG